MVGYDWISLTTDYGLHDGYVAVLHGVIARHAPRPRVIDVTHDIPPGDVSRGAAVLAQSIPHLPRAVHVAVVDPGVGTDRRAIALATSGGLLVGPDNGLLVAAAHALGGIQAAVELRNPDWFATAVSATFHGRDIFAPVAARLAAGARLADAGPPVAVGALATLPEPFVRTGAGLLEAEVLTVDHFGNVQLAAPARALAGLGDRLVVDGVSAVRGHTFGSAAPGQLVVYADSAGQVAIAVNGGRAVIALATAPGELLRLTDAPPATTDA